MNWLILLLGSFAVLTIGFFSTDVYKNDKFMKYIGLLSVFSTLAFILSIMISLERNRNDDISRRKQEDERKAAQFISETEKNWIDLERLFSDNYPYLTALYMELYPNNLITIPPLTSEQQIETQDKEYHTCQILLQTIENIVNTEAIQSLNYGWLPIFQSWLKSPKLQKIWNVSKHFFNPTTNTFIDGILNKSVKTTTDMKKLLQTVKIV
jgi:hypothetical protein